MVGARRRNEHRPSVVASLPPTTSCIHPESTMPIDLIEINVPSSARAELGSHYRRVVPLRGQGSNAELLRLLGVTDLPSRGALPR